MSFGHFWSLAVLNFLFSQVPGFENFVIETFATNCCLYSVIDKSFEFRDANTVSLQFMFMLMSPSSRKGLQLKQGIHILPCFLLSIFYRLAQSF